MTSPEMLSSRNAWAWPPAQERIQLQLRITDLLEAARLYRSCLTCLNFTEAAETCALAQARPPARVIAQGCESYVQQPPF